MTATNREKLHGILLAADITFVKYMCIKNIVLCLKRSGIGVLVTFIITLMCEFKNNVLSTNLNHYLQLKRVLISRHIQDLLLC